MTTIYFMRHSEVLKTDTTNSNDSLQIQNEKWVLTKNGDRLASERSKEAELQNFDVVISSNYARAISTAKYFTNDVVYVDNSFGERKFGISDWKDKPENFEYKQWNDFDYKVGNGESLTEVLEREENALARILNDYKNKKILIVGHSTAMAVLFSKWCELNFDSGYSFNGEVFFDGKWDYCETFRLDFDDKKQLVNIENIKSDMRSDN